MMRLTFLVVFLVLHCCMSYDPKCATTHTGGSVTYITDGKGNRRCFASITPTTTKPVAILFWFHGSGGNAAHCGTQRGPEGKSWGDYAIEQGFAFVCGEAIDGLWAIPEVITNETGTPCDSTDTLEVDYVKNIVSELQKKPAVYDTSKMFTSGCSMGSAFSLYTSICIHGWYPNSISSFMTHSTGLKIKGDGLKFPPDTYQPDYSWGECPKCQYFPARVPIKALQPDMKACIFDNTGDHDFYKSSLQLEKIWKMAGNPCQSSYGEGGHCVFHSFAAILNCLDDGTKRLLPNGNIPVSPTPPPSPTPAPAPTPGSGPSPACLQACNQVCPNLGGTGEACDTCLKKHQFDSVMMDNCPPTPWDVTLHAFCDAH